MAKGSSASDPSTSYTVFIETNLNTRLVMMISNEDTVLDFKQKIMNEHPHCFPDIGEITINALKVKRKAFFYHLVNSMLVKSVFDGVNRVWFLYVDAVPNQIVPMGKQLYFDSGVSNLRKRIAIMDGPSVETERNSIHLDVSPKRVSVSIDAQLPQVGRSNGLSQEVPPDNQIGAGDKGTQVSARLNMGMKNVNGECNKTSADTNRRSDAEDLEKHNLFGEGNEVAGTNVEHKKQDSRKRKEMCPDDIVGETPELKPAAKKKRVNDKKIESGNGVIVKDPVKEHGSGTFSSEKTSELENVLPQNSVEEALQPGTIAKKKRANDKKIESGNGVIVKDPVKEHGSGTFSSEKTSELENVLPQNSVEEALQPGTVANKKRANDKKIESGNGVIVKDPVKEHDSGTFPSKKTSELENVLPQNSVEEALQPGTVAKKKPKSEKRREQSLSSPVENPMKKNDVGTSLSRKETSELDKLFSEDPMKENDVGTSISRRQQSEEEVLIGNSLEEQVKTVDVNLSIKPVEKSVNKKKTKKKKSASLLGEVSAALLSKETAVHETSIEPSVNIHIDFDKESDAVISHKETALNENIINFSVTSEKEKNGDQVQEVGQGSLPPSQSHDAPHGVPVAETSVTEVDGVSRLAMEVDKDGGSKVESEKYASEKALASRGGKTTRAKKGKAATEKVLTIPLVEESDKLIKGIIPSAHDAGVPDSDNGSHDLTDKNKERKETLPLNGDPQLISSEATTSKSVVQDEAEKNIKDSNLLDTSDLTKTGDPSDKRKRKSKKSTKASGLKSEDANLLSSESGKAFDLLHPGDETTIKDAAVSRTEKETNIEDTIPSYKLLDVNLHHSEVTEAQDPSDKIKKLKKIKKSDVPVSVSTSGVVNAPSLGPDREANEGTAIGAASLQTTKIIGSQDTSDHLDHKTKKKSVKTRVSKPKSHPDPPKEDLVVSLEDISPSPDLKVVAPNKIKKSRSQKPGLVKETSSMVEAGKDNGMIEAGKDNEVIEAGKNNGDIGSSQIPLDTLEGNVHRRPHEHETNSHMEAPMIDGDEVNFKQYFVPTPDHHEVVSPAMEPGDKLVQDKTPDKKLKANKKMRKVSVHSVGTVADVQKSLSSNEDQGYKKKRRSATTDAIHGPLLEDEPSKPAPQPNVKTSVNAGGGMIDQRDKAEAPPSKVSGVKRVDASKPNTSVGVHLVHSFAGANAKPSKNENSVVPAKSSFNIERSVHRGQKTKGYVEFESRANHRRGDARKSSRYQIGEVLNNSNREKSLLATSNTIFEDSSSESTQDEGGISNSELTRSPSDYSSSSSSSSELSKGESAGSLDSPGNGSHGGRIMENGNADKSQARDMPLDMIFRSSRSYKKAKLTASQSQAEDTESQQPIEFVLDSQF